MLKSWWNKYFTKDMHEDIQNVVQVDVNDFPIFDEDIGTSKPDGINTLILTIIKHLIETPTNIHSRIHDQLINLTCPTLSDFRWYKDGFTSRVMLRDDCTYIHTYIYIYK